MSVDLLSEIWAGEMASPPAGEIPSPRISFSWNLDDPLENPHCHRPLVSPSSDFVFSIPTDPPKQDPAVADQLFSNGFLLPLSSFPTAGPPDPDQPAGEESAAGDSPSSVGKQMTSFWRFGKSISVNCGGGGRRSNLLRSLPLLQRSRSAATAKSPPIRSSAAPRSCYYYGYYRASSGVRISPVLNVSPACGIIGFFGLGHLLSIGGKVKNRKKTPLPTSP